MKKKNVIDFTAYRDERAKEHQEQAEVVNHDLGDAIDELIDQLRKGPIEKIS